MKNIKLESFRLLTELYSFLQVDYIYPLFWLGWYGFRLLTEYHSFLSVGIHIQLEMLKKKSFRLLMEYHSFLSLSKFIKDLRRLSFRLLMEYHSFLCLELACKQNEKEIWVSVSLWSIIHSYISLSLNISIASMFPSPYGVSFILMWKK